MRAAQSDSAKTHLGKAFIATESFWDEAVADDATNNYLAATAGYHTLMEQRAGLTDEQITAVNAAALALNQRLYAAANSGDAAAKDASSKLNEARNRQ